jgi:cyclohexanecarboxylate-CoA ligase
VPTCRAARGHSALNDRASGEKEGTMAFQISLSEARQRAEQARGLWPNRILTDYLDEAVRARPDQVAITGANSATGERTTLTFTELARRVDRIALGLAALGVQPGETVSFQLPNWWQYPALYLACVRIGAVANPLMPIFRQRELRYMLNFAESRVVIVPARYRDFDYAAMLAEIRPDLSTVRHTFVVDGAGEQSFERHFLERAWEEGTDAQALFGARRPDPNALTQLLYTSGTSGEPKAVMHVSNTLLVMAQQYIEWVRLTSKDVVFMASPLAYQTGFVYGMMIPVILGTKLVLLDIWSAPDAARLIQAEGATFTMASTPFLSDLAGNEAVTREAVKTLRTFVCAGAPIPSVIVQKATERLGIEVLSCWGMTENGGVTIARPGDPPEKIFGTDGHAIGGMEVRVVDADGAPVPQGTVGRLQARGTFTFVGYLKKPELNAWDDEGWFETGDLARMDKDGYVRITGRTKDVIIRGGENIPVIEIENLLYRHPKVQDVAVVAMPDPRLGERACAFVVPRLNERPTFEELTAFLAKEGMAKSYWPERLEIVEAMPRTPSGKIQKFKLRETAAKFGAG